jgi:hypothetical protein
MRLAAMPTLAMRMAMLVCIPLMAALMQPMQGLMPNVLGPTMMRPVIVMPMRVLSSQLLGRPGEGVSRCLCPRATQLGALQIGLLLIPHMPLPGPIRGLSLLIDRALRPIDLALLFCHHL